MRIPGPAQSQRHSKTDNLTKIIYNNENRQILEDLALRIARFTSDFRSFEDLVSGTDDCLIIGSKILHSMQEIITKKLLGL